MSGRSVLFRLGLLVLVFACNGCCLTSQLWERTERHAVALEQASLDTDGTLRALLVIDNGELWEARIPHALEAPGQHDEAVVQQVDDGGFGSRLPASSVPIRIVKYDYGLEQRATEGQGLVVALRDLGGSSYAVVYSAATSGVWHEFELSLPRAWWSGTMLIAVVLTPATVLVDCLTAPIEFGWILLSAGGHGRNPIPWCDR